MSERRVCVQCGRSFIVSYSEQRRYRENKLKIPKRCKACRGHNRADQQSGYRGFSGGPPEPTPVSWPSPPPQPTTATPRATGQADRSRRAALPVDEPPGEPATRSPRSPIERTQTPAARFSLTAALAVAAVAIAAVLAGAPWWAVVVGVTLSIAAIAVLLYRHG